MARSQVNPINIMVADDDDDDYLIFMLALEESSISFKISRAIDGKVLMKLLQENIPDILFLDLLMPCKDGHECLKEIRADKRYDSMPIIVFSSMNDNININKCYQAGSNFYAVKPGSIRDLKTVLERVLNTPWTSPLYYPPKSEFVLPNN